MPGRSRGRSVLAIVVGFIAVFVLSLGTDQVLHVAHVYPPWGEPMAPGLFVLATAYRLLFTVVGGVITARMAPEEPLRHAIRLGIVGTFFACLGVFASVGHPEMGPIWYPILLVLTALPCTYLGGVLAGVMSRDAAR